MFILTYHLHEHVLGIYTKILKVSECSYDKFAMLHTTTNNKNYTEYYNWLPWFVWCGPTTTVLDPSEWGWPYRMF